MKNLNDIFAPQQAANIQRRELFESIKQVQERISELDNQFDFCNDEDLLESCIYELKSLQCRYRFLYRQASAEGECPDISRTVKREG